MRRLATLSALLIVPVLLSSETCRAQFRPDEGSYAQLLAKYDRNNNGLLDDQERAALLAPTEVRQPLNVPAIPLICDGLSVGSGGGSSASAEQQQSPPPMPQVGRHVHWRRQQFAKRQPQGDPQPNQARQAEGDMLAERSVDGYPFETSPQPPEPQRQNVQFRNVVQYRMLMNEARVQARSQPFARSATFGPMLGRTKQQCRAARSDSCCASTRFTVYRRGPY